LSARLATGPAPWQVPRDCGIGIYCAPAGYGQVLQKSAILRAASGQAVQRSQLFPVGRGLGRYWLLERALRRCRHACSMPPSGNSGMRRGAAVTGKPLPKAKLMTGRNCELPYGGAIVQGATAGVLRGACDFTMTSLLFTHTVVGPDVRGLAGPPAGVTSACFVPWPSPSRGRGRCLRTESRQAGHSVWDAP